MSLRINKKSEEPHLVAQPPTLAAFLPWGNSVGADREALTEGKCKYLYVLIKHNSVFLQT